MINLQMFSLSLQENFPAWISFGQAEPQRVHTQPEQGRVQACLGHPNF